jgi:hypothetical protein
VTQQAIFSDRLERGTIFTKTLNGSYRNFIGMRQSSSHKQRNTAPTKPEERMVEMMKTLILTLLTLTVVMLGPGLAMDKADGMHEKTDGMQMKSDDMHDKGDGMQMKSDEMHDKGDNMDMKSDDMHMKGDGMDMKSDDMHMKGDGMKMESDKKM